MTLKEWANANPAHVSLQQEVPENSPGWWFTANYNIFMNMTNLNGNSGTYHQRKMFYFKFSSQFY